MRTEIPLFKRCCFCLPLRYGLIVWGYLRLCISIILLVALGYLWYTVFVRDKVPTSGRVYSGIATIVMIADFVLSLVFIVGCHKKNAKLMKGFYFYSQFLLGLSTVLTTISLGWLITALVKYAYYSKFYSENGFLDFCLYIVSEGLVYLAHLLLQLYMILLVRSEIAKLNNGCQFRFVNHAADAECTLEVQTFPTQYLPHDNETG